MTINHEVCIVFFIYVYTDKLRVLLREPLSRVRGSSLLLLFTLITSIIAGVFFVIIIVCCEILIIS